MRLYSRFIFTLALMSATLAHAQIIINELMQSNIDCVMDNIQQYPDSWVEIYNPDTIPANLGQYSIGLTDDPASAWRLPTRSLAARGYTLIFCDKVANGMHTDFRLESGKGGSVFLFRNGEIADCVTKIPKQLAPNTAYAIIADNKGKHWGYVCIPTPTAPNDTIEAKGVLPSPILSIDGGVTTSTKPRKLAFKMPNGAPQGTTIRYTLDGSEPTANSNVATTPIYIFSTRVVRAKPFCPGWVSPRSTVRSYIVMDHKTNLPVISIATDDKHLNDSIIGIFADGIDERIKNYQHDWRRPMNIELYEPDGTTCSINQICEGRVMGGASRANVLKSLALYANKRFGEKRFNYEFFPDQRPGQTNYKSFLLRNAGNDFHYLYMRDAVIQRTMAAHVDLDWQAWRPAVIYINGKYKGMLNIRDRSNDDNIFTHYDELEDIDMIKNGTELQQGTWDNYKAFQKFYTEHGHTWDEYAQWIDLDEYINVMAMNLFYANFDFPGNNIIFWRPRTNDGRWRILVKDQDYTLGIYDAPNSYNMVTWISNHGYDEKRNWANDWDHTRLFRRLMEDLDFQRIFIERCAIYMGDFMNERGTRAVWDRMYRLIKDEYPLHRALYYTWPKYATELTKARTWLAGRADRHYSHLTNYYGMGKACPLTINSQMSEKQLMGSRYYINGVELSRGDFDGKFPAGQEINLEARSSTPEDIEHYRSQIRCSLGWRPRILYQDRYRHLKL